MGVRIDIGVDADGYVRGLVHLHSQLVDHHHLRHRLDIEASYFIVQPKTDFPIGLTYPRVSHLLWRAACSQRGLDFSSTHQVCTQAGLEDFIHDAWIAIGLDCIVYGVMLVFG